MALHHRVGRWQRILLGILCFPFLPFYLCVYYLCLKEDDSENQLDEGQQDPSGRTADVQTTSNGRSSIFSISNKVHTETDGNVGQKRSSSDVTSVHTEIEGNVGQKRSSSDVTSVYPWDKSNLKSLQMDLKEFETLDSYASKLKARGSLEMLVKALLRDEFTDLQKTRVIWIWICHHIEYDSAALRNEAKRSSNPEHIFRTRRSVCAGYSALFERMCSIAGVQCKVVSGYGKGVGYTIGETISEVSDHSWNMVYLEGSWHLLDSTWGAGFLDSDTDTFKFRYNEFYFLTHPALIIESHLPENEDCQLLKPRCSKKHFECMAFRKSKFYNLGLLSSEPDKGVIETVNGKASIILESRQHMLFTFKLNETEKTGLVTFMDFRTKFDVYPQKTGKYSLKIYGKKADSKGNYEQVLSHIIDCKSVDTAIKFPKCLEAPNAPSWLTEKEGLLQPSHPDPIIYTLDGCFAVSFAVKQDLSIFCTLECDEQMTSEIKYRHIFETQKEERLEFKVRLPRPGTYVLNVNCKEQDSEDYMSRCNYLIICTNPSVHWPMFPVHYTSWREHYELVEPLDGILAKNKNVFFKLYVPDVIGLSVEGTSSFPLTLSDQGYWEGKCRTDDCKKLYVACIYKESPNNSYYIMSYEVK